MLLGDGSAAHLIALQARVHDQLAREVALGALERGAGARQVKRLLLLALAHEVVHRGADLLGVAPAQGEGGGQHHQAVRGHAAVAIPQVEVGRVNRLEGAVGRDHAHALEHVGHRPAVGARVHEAGPAHRARDAARKLQAREPQLARHLRGLAQVDARLARHLLAVHGHADQPVRHGHDDAAVPLVRDEQVRAAAQDKALCPGLVAGAQHVAHLVEVLRDHVEVGRAAHLEGGVLAHRLHLEDVVLANDGAQAPGKRLSAAVAL